MIVSSMTPDCPHPRNAVMSMAQNRTLWCTQCGHTWAAIGAVGGYPVVVPVVRRAVHDRRLGLLRDEGVAGDLRIYIASFFDTRDRLRSISSQICERGHSVTSRWINEQPPDMPIEEFYAACAHRDTEDIKRATALFVDTFDETPRGGREVELGLALALDIPTAVVGPLRNVFHRITTKRFETWEAALEYLSHRV